jgi:tRNA1Val (adenine37-N6)-methyltransferase
MKVGTDAVLLATLPQFTNIHSVLDIGTGTGVLSLMLAQQFPNASITAIELDAAAANQAAENFAHSTWAANMQVIQADFEAFSSANTYDLIISNPPFFTASLTSEDPAKNRARHAPANLLDKWIEKSSQLLNENGKIAIILPESAIEIKQLALQHQLFIDQIIHIHSFENTAVIRQIFVLHKRNTITQNSHFQIYKAQNSYSEAYIEHLKPYLTIF